MCWSECNQTPHILLLLEIWVIGSSQRLGGPVIFRSHTQRGLIKIRSVCAGECGNALQSSKLSSMRWVRNGISSFRSCNTAVASSTGAIHPQQAFFNIVWGWKPPPDCGRSLYWRGRHPPSRACRGTVLDKCGHAYQLRYSCELSILLFATFPCGLPFPW